jgi:hypothetical protein
MLPDCAAPSPKESDMFIFMPDVRPFSRYVSERHWIRYGAIMRPSAFVSALRIYMPTVKLFVVHRFV